MSDTQTTETQPVYREGYGWETPSAEVAATLAALDAAEDAPQAEVA